MSTINPAQNPYAMSGTRVLVTGAAGGIGSATARLCATLGARLILTDVAPLPQLEALANELGAVDSVHVLDVTNRKQVESVVKAVAPISALADTAGICPFNDDWMADDWNEAALMKVLKVNVMGPINMVRAVLPGMIERKYGRMALCGSIAGWYGGLRAGPHYAASKGSVHALVRWFSQRGAPHGVCINAVAPGPIDTGMTANQGFEPGNYPMKRLGEADEIAAVIAFLCSPAASYTSGAIFDVNGGTHLR